MSEPTTTITQSVSTINPIDFILTYSPEQTTSTPPTPPTPPPPPPPLGPVKIFDYCTGKYYFGEYLATRNEQSQLVAIYPQNILQLSPNGFAFSYQRLSTGWASKIQCAQYIGIEEPGQYDTLYPVIIVENIYYETEGQSALDQCVGGITLNCTLTPATTTTPIEPTFTTVEPPPSPSPQCNGEIITDGTLISDAICPFPDFAPASTACSTFQAHKQCRLTQCENTYGVGNCVEVLLNQYYLCDDTTCFQRGFYAEKPRSATPIQLTINWKPDPNRGDTNGGTAIFALTDSVFAGVGTIG